MPPSGPRARSRPRAVGRRAWAAPRAACSSSPRAGRRTGHRVYDRVDRPRPASRGDEEEVKLSDSTSTGITSACSRRRSRADGAIRSRAARRGRRRCCTDCCSCSRVTIGGVILAAVLGRGVACGAAARAAADRGDRDVAGDPDLDGGIEAPRPTTSSAGSPLVQLDARGARAVGRRAAPARRRRVARAADAAHEPAHEPRGALTERELLAAERRELLA